MRSWTWLRRFRHLFSRPRPQYIDFGSVKPIEPEELPIQRWVSEEDIEVARLAALGNSIQRARDDSQVPGLYVATGSTEPDILSDEVFRERILEDEWH